MPQPWEMEVPVPRALSRSLQLLMPSQELHRVGPPHLFSHTHYWRSAGEKEFPLDWRESRVMMETPGAFHK